MQLTFDPVRKRQFWLDFALAYETRFEPDEVPEKGRSIYVSTLTNSLIGAYLLGLADRVRPTLEAVVHWMESRPEPATDLFNEEWEHWRDGWYALYAWRRTLGLCKWLCGIEGAEGHFRQALDAEWQGWEEAHPFDVDEDFHLRRKVLPEHLAMTLSAQDPATMLPLRDAAGVAAIAEDQPPLLILGQYACLSLYMGNERDEQFDITTTKFLRAGMPGLVAQGRFTEAALWLKGLYWDSGAAQTPEQAMVRAYEFLPLARPAFVSY